MFSSPFPESVSFAVLSREDAKGYELPAEEKEALGDAKSEKRRLEFAMGRAAASKALQQLGISEPVLKGSRREPLWPSGYVGSITHCENWAIAAVALRSAHQSIGIDLEAYGRIRRDISGHLCAPHEKRWVDDEGEALREQRLIQLFSAKESAFKAVYPMCKCILGFQDIALKPSPVGFKAVLLIDLHDSLRRNYEFSIGIRELEGYVFTYTIIP